MANSVNLKAFLTMIRYCEGTSGPDGYRTMFGGGLFDSFVDHPRQKITLKLNGVSITSSAAGAYQFLERTWDGLTKAHKYTDFSPETQDKAAIELIKGREAYNDVLEGRFEQALTKCSWEWASLPPGRYGQPVKTVQECKQIYEHNGGVYMVAPIVAAVAPTFIAAAFEALAKNLPALGKLFGSGSDVSNRNIAAMEIAVNAIKETVGAKNEQEAVEIVQSDPAAARAANERIETDKNVQAAFGVDLSGVGDARKHDQARADSKLGFWKTSPAFAVTLLLLPLLYTTVILVLTGDLSTGFSSEMKASIASSVVAGILGGSIGFWLGASFTTSSSRGLGARPGG